MFRFKICGITSPADARLVAAAGADAIGLNFFPKSPRFVTAERAQEIVAALPGGVLKVGLFVNAEPALIRELSESLRLDVVQLHGDEPPELIGELAGLAVLKALRIGGEAPQSHWNYLEQCQRRAIQPIGWLIDAWSSGQYGGTGKTVCWNELLTFRKQAPNHFFVLAGGLTPRNVSEAIVAGQPDAVDVSSGVEISPGKKDPELVRAFIKEARAAFRL